MIQRIGTVLLWAKGNGHRSDSPTDEITSARKALPKHSDRQKYHMALPCAEVPSFVTKLRAFTTSEPLKLAFEFLILKATRSNEVLGARWPEIDLAKKIWTIPGPRMKANREHQVPLAYVTA